MYISEETRKKLVKRLNRDLEQDISNVETNELLDILDPSDPKDYIIQLRNTVETYYGIDENGNIDYEHPYEINDCIEQKYVVREKTAENCYGDLSEHSSYEEALELLNNLKKGQ